MDFAFSEEQLMIRDTAQAFLAEVSTSEAVRSAMVTEAGYDAGLWRRITGELCWQALHIPEEYGGLGLGYVELAAIHEQMGRYLLCAPYFSTVCLGANALLVAGTAEQKNEYLPRIADGSLTATLAWTGKNGAWDASAVEAVCSPDGDEYVLDGEWQFVPDGHTAGLLVLAARAAGSEGEEGINLFVMPADTPGLVREWQPAMDQTRRLARIAAENVRVPASALMGGEGWQSLSAIVDLATVALAAEQVGGAQQALDMSVDYTLERVQFGRPIASFQAIKHKAADMMLRVEVARSAAYYAACVAEEFLQGGPMGAELPEAASIVKSWCSEACFENAGEALQMHGGVGFTWEYDVHLYFKRAKSDELLFGSGAWHRERIARLVLDGDGRDKEAHS